MSDFNTGRRIDKAFAKIVNPTWDLFKPTVESQRLGSAMVGGEPVSAKDAVVGGLWSAIEAFPGMGVAGLTSRQAMKYLGKGLSKLPKQFRNVRNAQGLADVFRFVPEKALTPLKRLNVSKELPTKYPGSHVKATTTRHSGATTSDVAVTPRADQITGQHEFSSHVYNHALRQENSKAGKLTNILETISTEQEKYLDQMIKSGKIKEGSKEAYNLSRKKLSEQHAENFADVLAVEQTIAKMKNKKAFMAGKSRMSDRTFDSLHNMEVKKILNAYESKHPRRYAAGKLEAEKNWKAEKKADVIAKLVDQDTTQGSIKAVHKVFDKRFPDRVGNTEEAIKLGKEYPLKELNRVMVKEKKTFEKLWKKTEGKRTGISPKEYTKLVDRSTAHAIRGQGAREALESRYVETLGQTYGPRTSSFKPAKFKIWLANELKK